MDVTTSTARCPHCGAPRPTREIEVLGRRVTVTCACQCEGAEAEWRGVPRARRRYELAGIPPRYAGPTVDTMGRELAVAAGESLYIHGPNGTAKSTYAASLAKALLDMGTGVYWTNSKHLITEIQGTYSGRPSEALDRARSCKVLILDDLGKEQPTPYAISVLYELVEARYGANRPIVATSNFDRAELAARWAGADAPTAEAIVSRLCDGCESVEMEGADMRLR